MMKKYLTDIAENVRWTIRKKFFNFSTYAQNAMIKFIPLEDLNICANSGEKKLSPNTHAMRENQTKNGSKESTKSLRKTLSKEEREEKNEKAKLARILAKEKRTREERQHTANFYKRKAVQIRQAEEAYLPTPNQDYTYIFFCGAPERIRKNERTRTRRSNNKSLRVFRKSKWQGNSTDFN